MSKKNDIIKEENVTQAVIVADNFNNEFLPITNDIPLALLPLINRPLIDYTLEFLSLGGINEVFLFCCSHIEAIREHIKKSKENAINWTLTLKINIIVSESCRSFGDCLRDIDAKGLLRGSFVLVEPGTFSNIKLLPILNKHNKICTQDKEAAITLIYQECGANPRNDTVLAINNNNRVLFRKNVGTKRERKIEFPLDMFLENPLISLRHDLRDTQIAICSSSVLPLFSDNFDFQTKDDFIRGLLINDEIILGTIYCYILEENYYGAAVTNWRMYQQISRDLNHKWIYPILPSQQRNKQLKDDVVLGDKTNLPTCAHVTNSIIGNNVKLGKNVQIINSFIFSNCTIENNVIISHSIIGDNCKIKNKSKITAGSILGKGVVVESGQFLEDALVQSTKPEFCEDKDKFGEKCYRLVLEDDEDEASSTLARQLSRIHIDDSEESELESDAFRDTDDDELSHTQSPLPDDTKLFFTEVIDSLTRGFEDELQCDNLILEINSSRYAYNVSLKEVNFNVIKAILLLSLRLQSGPQYFAQCVRLLSYFSPILKNYIRNESAMLDSLQAIEEVAITEENINEKWVMFILKWFYDKDHLSEDVILQWYKSLDKKTKFHNQVKPFTDWLQEAEEESSEEEED